MAPRRSSRIGVVAAPSVILVALFLPAQARANPISFGPGVVELVGLPLVIAIEAPIVAAFFPGRRKLLAVRCAVATAVTYFVLHWFLALEQFGLRPIIVGEALATLAEAAVYVRASGELLRSLVASLVANVASFAAGLVLIAVIPWP